MSTTSSTEEPSIPTGRFKPLVSLLNHKWLALLIFIVVSAIGFLVASKLGKPTYTAKAVILVSPKFVPNLISDRGMDLGRTQYSLYIKQQLNIITRSDVLQEALQLPEVKDNWMLAKEEFNKAHLRLKRALSAKNKREDPFITVTLTDKNAKQLDIVLNAIIKIYIKKSQAEIFYDSSGQIGRLESHRDKLNAIISEKQTERTEIAEKLGVTTFQENRLNPYDEIFIESTSAFTQAHRRYIEAKTYLEALTDKQDHGKTTLDILTSEMVANDSLLKNYRTKLVQRRTELQTQIVGLTSKHPSRRRIEQEIAKINLDLETATKKLFKEIRNRLLEKNKAEVYQAQRIEQALEDELEKQSEKAKAYVDRYNKALVLTKEIDRAYRQLDTINNRIDFLTVESNAPGFARLETPAKRLPPGSKRKQIFLIFVVAAIGLGIAVPILIDLLDQSIHTPGEVHKILGFPPLAWILDRDDVNTAQFATDHLRRMALALERDWHTHETSCFVLTSVKPGGGTTTLTLELAQIISELGVRTLAAEFNAFKPDNRYTEGTSLSQGLATLLSKDNVDSLPLEMMIIPATTNLPDRLPVGKTQKRHLPTYGKLRSLLKQLNTHYDLILVDTPPLLLSADAELLGEIAGGVLLVIEAKSVTPGELKRAASLLERLNPPVVGAVLNRVKVFRGGGYFAKLLKEYKTGTKLPPGWVQRWFWR